MSSFVATSKVLTVQVHSFLDEAGSHVADALHFCRQSKAFRDIYKTSLAVEAILESLEDPKVQPSLHAMRSVSLRIPVLVSVAQSSIAVIELRRFLELTIWSIFFTHHPIEWQHFSGKRGKGFVRDPRLLIASAAHRDLNSYIEYAKEYMEAEPSGYAKKVLSLIESDKRLLNAATHAGDIARTPASNVPTDRADEVRLVKFAALQRRLFTHCIILTAAFNRAKYETLNPQARAYWQWLLGNTMQKNINSGDFGVYL